MSRNSDNIADGIAALEGARGYTVMRPGEVAWFPLADWKPASVASVNGIYVRLVLLDAVLPGNGAFRRLVAAVVAAGHLPLVMCPLGPMREILRRERWSRVSERPEEVWRKP